MTTRRLFLAAAPCALAALCAAPVAAQQTLTLQQAIGLAQRQGLPARAALGVRDAARARDRVFDAQYRPGLSITGTAPTYSSSITPVTQPDGSILYRSVTQTQGSLTASILQRIPWTNTTLSFNSGLSQVQRSGTESFRSWSSTPFSVGISQPILRANAQHWDTRQQELRYESAERRWLEALEDVAVAVTGAFFDLYAATLALRNSTANAATNDTLFTLNKGRYEVGKIGENDLLQSELALLRSRAALEDARLGRDRALSQFRIALNLPPGSPVDITVSPRVPDVNADTALAVEQARRNVAAMSDADLADVAGDRAVSEARWNTAPGGTLTASYGYNATAGTAPEVYKNLLDARQLTFGVNIPVWQWGAHSQQVAAAKADRESAKSNAQTSRAQAVHNAHFAALQLAQARRTLTISAKADTVAQKRFEVAYNRYVIGRITMDNLYLAQNEKDQALNAYVQAMRGYWVAYYQLRKSTLFDFEVGTAIR